MYIVLLFFNAKYDVFVVADTIGSGQIGKNYIYFFYPKRYFV